MLKLEQEKPHQSVQGRDSRGWEPNQRNALSRPGYAESELQERIRKDTRQYAALQRLPVDLTCTKLWLILVSTRRLASRRAARRPTLALGGRWRNDRELQVRVPVDGTGAANHSPVSTVCCPAV